jgi:SAM-dependent methyltransferase
MHIDWDRFARLYDDDYGDFTADLDLYLPLAQRTGGPVLEAMCGTGRVLLPLARAGLNTVGLDLSPAMVALARAKLEAGGLSGNNRVEVGDIRSIDLPERFALAVVPMNSFMHLPTSEDHQAALRSLRAHLRLGGLLVLDLFNPDPRELVEDQSLPVHAKSFTSSAGDAVQKWVLRRTDYAGQMHYVEFMYDEIGADRVVRRDILPFTMRWFYRFELEYLLAQTGFAVEALFGSYDLDDYSSDSDRLIVVARRKPGRRLVTLV